MAYTIPYTDQTKGTLVVEDNTINNETTIKFPGRNVSSYGTVIAENFLKLLENFASATEPARASEGQLWYDTTPNAEQLKVYDGTSWVPAGGLNKGPSEPDVALSQTGDLWVDTDNQQLYLNSGSGWVLVGPEFSDGLVTGASPLNVVGSDNIEYTVIIVEVQAQPVAIIASDSFTPKSVIPGFTTLKPGINLSNRNITGGGTPKFIGTSEKAESLIVNNETVLAGNFLRGDTTSTTLFPLNVQNNTGLTVGTDAALNVAVEGQAGIIQHQIEGSNIDVRVRNQGLTKTVLRVDSALRLGVNNEAPDEALDVVGNIQTDSRIIVNGTTESSNISTGSITTKGGAGIAKSVNIGSNLQVNGITTLGNTIPDGNNTRNLGSATSKWQNVYATTFVGNITGNVNGTVSGTAGTANKLTSASTFRLIGDIEADDVTFDGQTGGSLKIFDTTVTNGFIASKLPTTTTESTDEILIDRQGGVGLRRISRNNLLKAVPTFTAGMILPYAGPTPPNNAWLLCDGSEYRISEYNNGTDLLFDIIGFTYGARTLVSRTSPTLTLGEAGLFRVPDLRGRIPLGADNMGGTNADVVQADYADGLGQIGGSEEKNIEVSNLPEHKHDLKGDGTQGAQYFAIRDISGTPSDPDAFTYDAPTGLGNGQALPNSGGILDYGSQDPFNIMNPTLTLNYIIYTGRALT